MPTYTSFQFLQSIEDKLSEKVFSEEPLKTFSFATNRLLNFREEQATLKITVSLSEEQNDEAQKETKESETEEEKGQEEPTEKTFEGGKIEIQEVPHKGPASAFQCFISMPDEHPKCPTLMLIKDDNLLEREALKIALFYNYYFQEAFKDKLPEDTFKPLSEAALKTDIIKKVDELVPRIEPKTEEPKEEKTEAQPAEEKEEAKAAS